MAMKSTEDKDESQKRITFNTSAMIRKPTIIITSVGRTGTKFFAALFNDIMPHATSLHEPDVFNFFQYQGVAERFRQTVKQIQEAGFYNLFVRKALGQGSVIKLSDARVRRELDYDEAVRRLLKQRRSFVDSREGSVYVESNAGFYGLIDTLSDVFERQRTVYLIRDGRDWVRSKMNWGQMYNKGTIRSIFAHTWPTALRIPGDPYAENWTAMSRFEKICWAWVRLNKYALDTARENPTAKVFRFEDIFESNDRYQHLTDLVNFATDMPDLEPVPPQTLAGWLDRRIHKSSREFPAWSEWSAQHKQQFVEICGSLMEELGYEFN